MAGTSLPAVPTAMKMSKSQPALDAAPAASLKPSPSLPALPAAGGGQPGAPSAAIDDDESTLDGETLAEETIDATFLTGADDDASFLSQSSVRSYPEHPYALPNTMPHLCKPEDREVRVRQRRSHQGEVRRRREKLRKDATDNVVRSLEEHARRVEERRLRGVRLERGRKWLALIARVAAHDWAEQSLRGAEEFRARKARQARFDEKKNESATVIQHAMRNALLRSGHSVLREFWQKMAKFSAKVNPQRWRCQLHIRCWRRKSAVALLKMFLQEGLTHRGTQAVLNFMAKVRRLQRMAFDWLQARAKRKELLRQIWDDCESILRAVADELQKPGEADGVELVVQVDERQDRGRRERRPVVGRHGVALVGPRGLGDGEPPVLAVAAVAHLPQRPVLEDARRLVVQLRDADEVEGREPRRRVREHAVVARHAQVAVARVEGPREPLVAAREVPRLHVERIVARLGAGVRRRPREPPREPGGVVLVERRRVGVGPAPGAVLAHHELRDDVRHRRAHERDHGRGAVEGRLRAVALLRRGQRGAVREERLGHTAEGRAGDLRDVHVAVPVVGARLRLGVEGQALEHGRAGRVGDGDGEQRDGRP
jgi:hypothetical protein